MKVFDIDVDGLGFFETYEVYAKDLRSAKRKARAMAIRDFRSSLKITKAIY